jgi:pimeloyl-ACP methyl ester carboxylesterase
MVTRPLKTCRASSMTSLDFGRCIAAIAVAPLFCLALATSAAADRVRRHWQERNPEVDRRRTATTAALKFPTAETAADSATLGPDAVLLRMVSEQRPGVIEARNDLWFDYGSNVAHYSQWQGLLRSLKLPVLVVWGDCDKFFTTPGAKAYLRDAPLAEVHVLDVGHFATLEAPGQVAGLIADFVKRHDLH